MIERDRLEEIVARQDYAIDRAINALAHLSQTGSLSRAEREETIQTLVKARNERMLL